MTDTKDQEPTVIIGDPRPAGTEGPAGDQRPGGVEGPAGDPRPGGVEGPAGDPRPGGVHVLGAEPDMPAESTANANLEAPPDGPTSKPTGRVAKKALSAKRPASKAARTVRR